MNSMGGASAGCELMRAVIIQGKSISENAFTKQTIGDMVRRNTGLAIADIKCKIHEIAAWLRMPVNRRYAIKRLRIFTPRNGRRIPEAAHPGGWAVEISSVLGATHYINPVGGKQIFVPDEFRERGIELSFLPPPRLEYDCSPYEFIEHLSILDVLMWNELTRVFRTV